MKNNLYCYKNEKGFAISGATLTHTDKIWMATFTNKPDLSMQAKGYEILTLTIEEFKKMYAPIVTEILVLGDLLHEKYKSYRQDFNVIGTDHKIVKQAVDNAKNKLRGFHNQIDEILGNENGAHDKFYDMNGAYMEVIKHIADIGNFDAINAILRAYKKDPSSIEGICKKVLR